MSEKNPEPQTCDIDIEEPREVDSFLEEYPQVENYNDHIQYPPPYSPLHSPQSNLPASDQKPRSYGRLGGKRMHEAYDESQGPLLKQDIAHQQQFQPTVQCIVRQGTQPLQGGYIDMTRVQLVTQPPAPHIPDYFCVSLLVCIFCAWPCGMCAMGSANKARNQALKGQYAEAKSSANCALYLIIASVIFGLISIGVTIAEIYTHFDAHKTKTLY